MSKNKFLDCTHKCIIIKPDGVILADNVLWDGKVLDITQNNDEETIAIDRFNNHVQNDIRV